MKKDVLKMREKIQPGKARRNMIALAFLWMAFFPTGWLLPKNISAGMMLSLTFAIWVLLSMGIGFLIFPKFEQKNAQKRQYIAVIDSQKTTPIDALANAIPTSYENAMRDIQKLIEQGFFEDAYIDASTRSVITEGAASTETGPAVVIACASCGAKNTVTSSTGKCEYCGAPLSAAEANGIHK